MTESTDPPGIVSSNVTEWLGARVSLTPPVRFDPILGGMSNLTYLVTDDSGRRWVLRRPPLGHVLATAHDVAREHRLLTALNPTAVPVPPVVGLCTDTEVTGAPFFVMEFVDGVIARDIVSAGSLVPSARYRAGDAMMQTLAEIHAVDVDAVGLGDLGRRESYVQRQLTRWSRQWEATRDSDHPEMERLAQRLTDSVPPQHESTIVHGDFRLDNCILDPHGEVLAVLDWELCTLGDPRADLGLMLVYWSEAEDVPLPGLPTATRAEGFPSRRGMLDRYAIHSGRGLDGIDYFTALGYWKLACILQGVVVRFRSGAMGAELAGSHAPAGPTDAPSTTDPVTELARRGLAALDGRLGSGDG